MQVGASCWAVGAAFEERVAHAQMLIRPEDVRHLIVPARPQGPYEAIFGPPDGVADRVAAFMRTFIRYEPDPPTYDRWCTPARTLKKQAGDCDDMALLAVSLVIAAGAHGEFVFGTMNGVGHAWVEGRDEFGEFRLEATNGRVDRTPSWLRLSDSYLADAHVTRNNWRLAARHVLAAF